MTNDQWVVHVHSRKGAKAQRKNINFSLRLCAFAGIYFVTIGEVTMRLSLMSNVP